MFFTKEFRCFPSSGIDSQWVSSSCHLSRSCFGGQCWPSYNTKRAQRSVYVEFFRVVAITDTQAWNLVVQTIHQFLQAHCALSVSRHCRWSLHWLQLCSHCVLASALGYIFLCTIRSVLLFFEKFPPCKYSAWYQSFVVLPLCVICDSQPLCANQVHNWLRHDHLKSTCHFVHVT